MQYAYKALLDMLSKYEQEHSRKPQVIALGKTHIEDLQNQLEVREDGVYFEGVEVIQHNDPIGVLMAGKK